MAIDWRVLGVSAGAALVTGIAFGLAPVFSSARSVDQALKEHSRADTASGRRHWLRAAFLVAEVALAVVLLVGAALFLTSFARVMRIDLGVDYRNVALVDVRPRSLDADARKTNAVRLTAVLDRIRGIPGVEAAALANSNLPFTGMVMSGPVMIPGRTARMAPGNHTISYVSADYFRALRVPVVAGRTFAESEGEANDSIAVINASVARTYYPGQDPVGQVVSIYGPRTIVGVVGDIRAQGPEQNIAYEFYVPSARATANNGTFVVRASRNVTSLVPQIKAAVWSEFPDLAIPAVRTLEERFGLYIAERRSTMLLLTLFGILGVTIAAAGIYGVMSYVVTQRTREIGIRMALGAQPGSILMSVLRRASTHAAVGLAIGLVLAWMLAASVKTLLFQIQPHDPRMYAGVGGVLVAVALAAALFPARRAARVDPVVALRLE
jgi:predicted permease